MKDQIRQAFEEIHAGADLKARTKAYVRDYGARRQPRRNRRLVLALCTLLILFGIGGALSYAVPVAAISVDINPSLELEVNLYGRVVGAQGYNEDGEQVLRETSVYHMDYADAVAAVLENETVVACRLADDTLEVTVCALVPGQDEKILSRLSASGCVGAEQLYRWGGGEQRQAAHEAGLSFGKYRAFLALQVEDPQIQAEDVQDLSMGEIRRRIQACRGNQSQTDGTGSSEPDGQNSGNGGQGSGNGSGHRYGAQ